jgi:hypothetical protein
MNNSPIQSRDELCRLISGVAAPSHADGNRAFRSRRAM